jgi:hypothetical protein
MRSNRSEGAEGQCSDHDGVFAGFVELAIPIGDHLPHFDRG